MANKWDFSLIHYSNISIRKCGFQGELFIQIPRMKVHGEYQSVFESLDDQRVGNLFSICIQYCGFQVRAFLKWCNVYMYAHT